jgi:UDP-glucose 4-epimerase
MRNILITGGKGYLGGRLTRHLADAGAFRVRVASRNPTPGAEGVVTETGIDWESQESLHAACAGMDAVVHLAAMNATDSGRDPIAALRMNGVGTVRLLEAAKSAGVRRFVYMSTAHVYGSPLAGVLSEETCPMPVHPYATSHRAAEDAVLATHWQGGLEGIVLRLSNSFGVPVSVDANCWDLLFNDLCRQLVGSGTITLRSSGLQRRDFIPITDVCRAIQHVLGLPLEASMPPLFNVGGNWSPTILEAAQFVADRFEHITGRRLGIARPTPAPGETAQDMEYRTERLYRTGFRFIADRTQELDDLIEFCRNAFGG